MNSNQGLIPDFQGGGIVNLMSSIIQGRGGESEYPSLGLLPPGDLNGVTNVVLLVVDGLGDDWLARRSADGILSRHRLGSMTSVFPSTTATAITTYLTGDAPLLHALTGWYTWIGELGCVMTVLPGVPRCGGVPYRKAGIDPIQLFGHRPLFDRLSTRSYLVAPNQIAHSDFNLSHTGPAKVVGFDSLEEMFRRSAKILRWELGPKYLYLYWPELDSIGHRQGMESPAAAKHLEMIEGALEGFLDRVAGTDTLVLVAADHGQLDSAPADLIDLKDHPILAECLALPLCGEPRAAFAYLRCGREQAFLDYCAGPLAGLVEVRSSQQIRSAGWFGAGSAHPRFDERIGDYCLLPTGNRVIRQTLPLEQPHLMVGQHGGLSQAELMVPLCAFRI